MENKANSRDLTMKDFNAGIFANLEKEAEKDFKVKISASKGVFASVTPSFSIAIAPIKSKKNDVSKFALVKIFSVQNKKQTLMPNGTFILGREGKKSFLTDENNQIVVKGNVHAAPKSINASSGTIVITVGNGKICIYWDDPTDGGPFSNPKCHCHCFVFAKAAI